MTGRKRKRRLDTDAHTHTDAHIACKETTALPAKMMPISCVRVATWIDTIVVVVALCPAARQVVMVWLCPAKSASTRCSERERENQANGKKQRRAREREREKPKEELEATEKGNKG